ncbi:uncharacterized protein LOC110834793 isoform X2 [Zootermopsis nevadensis]|uniref:uncharacterized protein LOC110834793 isoform X2 n=1 Tax=Zootermopsis nevadensis TaxID=136037 RepID=UPI000B8E9500|nr:uncharacterized protein LOC110834793 isoform X2 [Zootermopsis nevadensis]
MVEGGDDVTPIGQTLGEDRQSRTPAVQDHSEWQPRSTIRSLIYNSARKDIVYEASISAAQRVENPATDIPDARPQERPNQVIPQKKVASTSDVRRVDEYSQPITRTPTTLEIDEDRQQTNEINDRRRSCV